MRISTTMKETKKQRPRPMVALLPLICWTPLVPLPTNRGQRKKVGGGSSNDHTFIMISITFSGHKRNSKQIFVAKIFSANINPEHSARGHHDRVHLHSAEKNRGSFLMRRDWQTDKELPPPPFPPLHPLSPWYCPLSPPPSSSAPPFICAIDFAHSRCGGRRR